MSEQKNTLSKLLRRLLALVLVVTFFFAFLVGSNIRININSQDGTDTERAAADYLLNNTEYLNQNLLERTRVFLSTKLVTDAHFADFYNMASVAIGQGDYEDALKYISSCIGLYRDDDEDVIQDLYIKKGCLEAMLSEYGKALGTFEGLTEDNRYRSDIGQIIVNILIQLNRVDDARSYLEDYLNVDDDAVIRQIYGEVLYTTQEYQLGVDTYSKLIDADLDTDGSMHFMRGLCYEQSQNYESALKDFTAALELDYYDLGICYNQIAICHYILGSYEAAITAGDAAIDAESEQVIRSEIYNIIGLSHFQLNEYQPAIENLGKAVEGEETTNSAYYYRGVCYMVEGEYQLAIDDYTLAISYEHEIALSYYNRALCFTQLNKIDEAISDFEMVKEYTEDEEVIKAADDFISMLS